uniref:CidA/LrgA family protein n=1 Tax=Janibacter limosus TaxID=53458 RepID=A0AC61U1D3_9MICO|nr:CidA/LrgA family protein [Janibacter limosus]
MGFVNGLLWLSGCQLVGEVISHALGLPIPGSVIGMVLLFGVLLVRKPEVDSGTLGAADGLLRHLQLLFIPAGVGVMVSFGELRADWLPIGGGPGALVVHRSGRRGRPDDSGAAPSGPGTMTAAPGLPAQLAALLGLRHRRRLPGRGVAA